MAYNQDVERHKGKVRAHRNRALALVAAACLLVLPGWMAPATVVSAAADSLLHTSDRFACSLPDALNSADCLAHGGTWNPSRKWDGGWGISGQTYGAFACGTCHARNPGNGNIKRLRSSIVAPTGAFPGGTTVTTRTANPDLASAFGDDAGGHATSEKICEVCHSRTRYHRFDTSGQLAAGGGLGHFNDSDCMSCHRHNVGFRAICSDCHGNSGTDEAWPDGLANNVKPDYAANDEAGSHSRHVGALGGNGSCGSCHPPPESGATHLNATVDLLTTTFNYTPATQSCANIACHGDTQARWGDSGCLGCHAVSQGNREAVGGKFAGKSHHVQGVEVAGTHCFACHWEANSDGTIASAYHGGGKASGSPVDLVIFGAGTRPASYEPGMTAISYTADGSRGEIAALNAHCLGCHSDPNNTTTPFGDGKTPNHYAWDGTSIGSRYQQTQTTPWGKYTDTASNNITPKSTQTKAYSAHGNAQANQGGWNLSETWPNTRAGGVNVACFDCHNAHGSSVPGKTTSYASATVNGGLLKETSAGIGGYAMGYQPAPGGSPETKNVRNAGASLCFDCHLTATGGTSTPWGYQSTFGASQPIIGYYDTPAFAPGNSGPRLRYPYRQAATYQGGHFAASSSLDTPAMASIDGLCTPCHDPHGVSPSLGAGQQYGVPLLKGTWLTSPYLEDVAPPSNIGQTSGYARIDQNTFGLNLFSLVTGITQTDSEFAGLCLRCHPKNSLTDGVTHTWKSKDRIHESVKGWKTANATVKHNYSCSKCHTPHIGSSLPRLMVTNCLDATHKGRTVGIPNPVLEGFDDWGTRTGRIPGWRWDNPFSCHEGPSANNHSQNDLDQGWNEVTPWYVEPTTLAIATGPTASSFSQVGSSLSATVAWTTNVPSRSSVDYGLTAAYGATVDGAAWVTSHSLPLPNLTNHATYHYRARATTYGGQIATSTDRTFYISFPPTVPTEIAEPDLLCAADCSATLAWNAATDPVDNGPIEYYAELSTSPTFAPLVANSGWMAATSWDVALPQGNVAYYWRVRARDANHVTAQDPASAWSAIDSFIVSDGSAPQIAPANPVDNFTGGGYDGAYSMTFDWTASPPAQAYRVQVSTDAGFATVNNDSGWIASTSWTVGLTHPSSATTTYYWRVQGKLADETTGPWSPIRTFAIVDYGTSSCPFLFTWNGEKFVFEADLYGAGKLATKTKTGYLKPEPRDYYVLKNRPVSRDGTYELRLVEERYEIDYLDEFKLYTLDAPKNRRVFAEKPQAGGSPPFTGLGAVLHTIATDAAPPVLMVHVNRGEDVTAKLAADDGDYVVLNDDRNVDFTYQTLELDLGAIQQAPRVKIAMDAMSMFPDSEEGIARSATFGARTLLEVQDAAGAWVKVAADKGSLPKAPEFSRPYVFDISNIWISDRRKVRFTFLFKTYVDWILVDTTEDVPITITEVPMATARLGARGIDPKSTDGELYEYVYGPATGRTAYLPGNYTRFGDVGTLLTATDDKFVIYGGGDEIVLSFLPTGPPAPEMRRAFLVYTNGYYKDVKVDVPHTVTPLPFAGMSNFPYDPDVEHYPDDPDREAYLLEYNTRTEGNE